MPNRLLGFAEFCESKKCKAMLGLLATGILLFQSLGCRERGTGVSGYVSGGYDDPRVVAQIDAFDKQLAKTDEQQLKVDEQARRFDILLDKWEQQAQRYDNILDRWAKAIVELERINK